MQSLAPVLAFLDVGGPEMLLILVLVLVLFGGKRMPDMARTLGKSMRDFKKAREGVEEQIKRALDEEPAPPKRVKKLRAANGGADAAAATTAATGTAVSKDGGSEVNEAGPDADGVVKQTSASDDDSNYVDPYEDEYIGGTAKSNAGAHGTTGTPADTETHANPANPDGGTSGATPKKSDSAPDAADGGGI